MKSSIIIAIAFLALLTVGCMENNSENKPTESEAFSQKVKKARQKTLQAMLGIHPWLPMTVPTTR